jgi:hypothetical protein
MKRDISKEYMFVDGAEGENAVAEIILGEFMGYQYRYGVVTFKEEEGDEVTLQYHYDLIAGDEMEGEELQRFEQLVGDVLTHVIEEYSKDQEEINANRTSDTKEPDKQ